MQAELDWQSAVMLEREGMEELGGNGGAGGNGGTRREWRSWGGMMEELGGEWRRS